ncbi:DUF3515 domain-containing protein [Streptomyces sp. NPDC046831]|uniref:DUF3515 domain-containing protein n=1 Tax=Streptomyces sp. NPDC046831 TaxID=3154805 RepID=UPI0033D54390
MNSSRHRLIGLPVLAVLIAAAGCSSADHGATAAVPRPGAAAAKLCRALDGALPRTVDGASRQDPEPASALTAGWGSPAIILRCGVPRPAELNDPEAEAAEVNGVDWLLQEQGDGSFRFTTTLRLAYVEVTIPAGRRDHGVAPLVSLAPAVRRTIPIGVAD